MSDLEFFGVSKMLNCRGQQRDCMPLLSSQNKNWEQHNKANCQVTWQLARALTVIFTQKYDSLNVY